MPRHSEIAFRLLNSSQRNRCRERQEKDHKADGSYGWDLSGTEVIPNTEGEPGVVELTSHRRSSEMVRPGPVRAACKGRKAGRSTVGRRAQGEIDPNRIWLCPLPRRRRRPMLAHHGVLSSFSIPKTKTNSQLQNRASWTLTFTHRRRDGLTEDGPSQASCPRSAGPCWPMEVLLPRPRTTPRAGRCPVQHASPLASWNDGYKPSPRSFFF